MEPNAVALLGAGKPVVSNLTELSELAATRAPRPVVLESRAAFSTTFAMDGQPEREDYAEKLAAAYAFGLSANHPFIEGNARTAFLAPGLFLAVNGWRLVTTQIDAIETMMALANDSPGESDLAAWNRQHAQRADWCATADGATPQSLSALRAETKKPRYAGPSSSQK